MNRNPSALPVIQYYQRARMLHGQHDGFCLPSAQIVESRDGGPVSHWLWDNPRSLLDLRRAWVMPSCHHDFVMHCLRDKETPIEGLQNVETSKGTEIDQRRAIRDDNH
jgi:hypothetical protein